MAENQQMIEILIECGNCGVSKKGSKFTKSYLICKSCIENLHGKEALDKAINEDKGEIEPKNDRNLGNYGDYFEESPIEQIDEIPHEELSLKLSISKLTDIREKMSPIYYNYSPQVKALMNMCVQCAYCGEIYAVFQRTIGKKKYCPYCKNPNKEYEEILNKQGEKNNKKT